MFSEFLPPQNLFVTAALFIATYLLTISFGRYLKRRSGVRFGVLFQFFCLTLAFYAAIAAYGVTASWRGHIGSLLVLLSAGVLSAVIDRYLWDFYFERRRQIVIPRLLRDSVGSFLFFVALVLVLSIGYHAETQLKG